MKVKVLGPGCMKCNKLFDEAVRAIEESGVDAVVEKVADLDEIMGYGVMMTPALVIDEAVVSSGKLLKSTQIVALLTKAAAE